MIRATIDLLTMKAFQPDIRNHQLSFGKREVAETVLGVSMHRGGMTFCCVSCNEGCAPSLSKIHSVEEAEDEALGEALVQFSRTNYLRYAIGVLSYDFTIERRQLADSPPEQDPETLRNNPSTLLGEEIEKGERYSIIRQPNHPEQSLVFTYKLGAIRRFEKLIARSPLGFLQIGGGIEWALSHWLEHGNLSASDQRPVDLVIYDYPTITIFQLDGQQIGPNIFCRTDSSGAFPSQSPIVRKGLERYLRSGSRVVLLDISLAQFGDQSSEDSLSSILEDVVGEEDLEVTSYKHPFQLLLGEQA